tara:strand:- start:14428 stop:14634 length:207 start_codon:yes stop_codon:yes gene_type:complete
MPSHYGDKKGMKGKGKGKGKAKGMAPMSKADHEMFKKAVKQGILTQKQHNSLPAGLLKGIIKKKGGLK